ncbi:hypothetical protein CC86DRAFT_372623 [Ophiobolus disseminans]|uniref:F-box domain-containing protein n=1 Tax=Ophiobolus disseminans TaxID=1469910 RepID=A0A6A6ZPW2_9PLEO|nr:hypothetical protein CC86DRAFT_372623 [Ophiobolus disseminans]
MSGRSKTSLPPLHGRCLLLELPRELRDEIYLHVLAHQGGLVVYVSRREPRMVVRGRSKQGQPLTKSFTNPLMFASRQLAQETSTITFKANNYVAVYGVDFATPSSFTFSLFITQIGVATTSRLRKVTVNGSPGSTVAPLTWKEVSSYFDGFRSFCALHPQIKVVLRFRVVKDVNGATWLSESIALKAIIRGVDTVKYPFEPHHQWIQRVLLSLRSTVGAFQSLPTNLGFSILDAVPEDELQKGVSCPVMAKYPEAILIYANELWEEGI